jgi:hypothetical protein
LWSGNIENIQSDTKHNFKVDMQWKDKNTYIVSNNNGRSGLFGSFLCTFFTSDRELTNTNVFPTLGSIIMLHKWKMDLVKQNLKQLADKICMVLE